MLEEFNLNYENNLDKLIAKIALVTLVASLVLLAGPWVSAEPWHEGMEDGGYDAIYVIPINVEPWTPPDIVLPIIPIYPIEILTEFDYYLWTSHGGWWYDAEKTTDNTDDDDMCWAAACSNALEWTGWGIVTDPVNLDLVDTDDMFQNFNYYWLDSGGFMSRGWDWWFDGTDHTKLEIKDSGNYFDSETYSNYYDEEWNQELILPRIDEILHRGDCVTLGIRPVTGTGGHAITCWGYRYDTTADKDADPDGYYLGVWITDSDDNKGSNTADPPPNTLRYYEVDYDFTEDRWEMTNYGNGWYIEAIMALAPRPGLRPVASFSPTGGFEGSAVTFTALPAGMQYRWDLDDDNLWDGDWSSSSTISFTWNDDYQGKVRVEVFDGIFKDVHELTVTIINVAPTVNAGADQTVDEGSVVSFSGGFTDPGDDTHTIEWSFGDGSPAVTGTLTPTHVYADDGTYTVTLTVTDDDGGTNSDTLTVTVENVAPTIGSLNIDDVYENGVATLTGTITDPGSLDTFTLTVDWGEGSPETFNYPAGTTSFSETHQYLDDNPTGTPSDIYTVSATLFDDDGGSDSDSTSLTVSNIDPVVDAGLDQTVDEGEAVYFYGYLTDTGTLDTHTISWDFGDGSIPVTGTFTPTHVYADDGTYTITLTGVDDDTGFSSDTIIVTVENVAPSITSLFTSQSNPQFILPDVHEISFTAEFTDPGWLDTHVALWDYGDGTVVPGCVAEENLFPDSTGTVTGTHTYAAPGSYTVTLTVTDDDGGFTTDSIVLNIVTVEEAVADTDDYIQGLPDEAFSKKADQQKKTFMNMFQAVQDKLSLSEYQGAINHLTVIYGLVDGEGKDWVTDAVAQSHLQMKINDIIDYLTLLL